MWFVYLQHSNLSRQIIYILVEVSYFWVNWRDWSGQLYIPLNIFKISKVLFWTNWRKNCISYSLWALFCTKLYKACRIATTSKASGKSWAKFHIQIFSFSFTRDNNSLLTYICRMYMAKFLRPAFFVENFWWLLFKTHTFCWIPPYFAQ